MTYSDDFREFLDSEWANMSCANKAYTLFGDVSEAYSSFKESPFYNPENETEEEQMFWPEQPHYRD